MVRIRSEMILTFTIVHSTLLSFTFFLLWKVTNYRYQLFHPYFFKVLIVFIRVRLRILVYFFPHSKNFSIRHWWYLLCKKLQSVPFSDGGLIRQSITVTLKFKRIVFFPSHYWRFTKQWIISRREFLNLISYTLENKSS